VGGLVQYLPSGKSEWVTVNQVTLINEGDQVRTGEGGIAKLNVVTGTQVDIFPSSVIALNALSMGDGKSGMTFNMLQLQGMTEVTVSQTIKAGDSLTVSTPTFTANIRGTKFKTGVASDGSAIAFTDEGTIVLLGADGKQIEVGPGGFAAATLNTSNAPADANADFLGANVVMKGFKDQGVQDTLKSFLKAFLKDNNSALTKGFIAALVGADANASTDDLLAALDGATLNFDTFKTGFSSFVTSWSTEAAKNPLAPVTCGDGQQQADETSANCPEDFADLSGKGNKVCEADKGESIINDAEDCAPLANLLSSAALLNGKNGKGGPSGGPVKGGTDSTGGPDQGIGSNGGTIITGRGRLGGVQPLFSTTGGAKCVFTVTVDANLRSIDDGHVVGVAAAGSSFTIVGKNENGWVTDGNVSIATGTGNITAGCS